MSVNIQSVFTGTLDGANVNQLVLEGLFGRCTQVTRTNQLMKAGHVAKLKVKIILLKHEEKLFEGYQDEIGYLVEHEGRNKFIRNLAWDLKGNTLILFNYVERHGVPLYNLINSGTDQPVHFVHGGVDVEDKGRDSQTNFEISDNSIIIASYGTFSTGINIKKLHNVIFASPSKSRVRNLQSIGRVLRKGENKSQATLYDIADDISTDEGNNYTLNHLMERVKVYNEEKFNYEIIDVKVNMINYARHDEEFYGIFKLVNGEEVLGKAVATEDNGETLVFLQDPVSVHAVTKEIGETKVYAV